MADDIIEQSGPKQGVTLFSAVQSLEDHALAELLSTPSRKKPEQIMTYCGRAIHIPESDTTMHRSYETERQNYAYAQWIKEEGEKQLRLYQEVNRHEQTSSLSAGQSIQSPNQHTRPSAPVYPDPQDPETQQRTFYRNLARAPVLIAHSSSSGSNLDHGTGRPQQGPLQRPTLLQSFQGCPPDGTPVGDPAHQEPQQASPQKPTLLQRFQGYPPDGVLRGYPPDGSLNRSPGPWDLRQAHHQAAQQASHRLGAQLATRALYQVINQPPPPATQPPSQTRQVVADLRPRRPVTPSKLRYANAVAPTPPMDARANILQILQQDKLRRKPMVPAIRPAPNVGPNSKRDATPSALEQESPSKRIRLTQEPTVEVVDGKPFATTKQTALEPAPPSPIPLESTPVVRVHQQPQTETQQVQYDNDQDAKSGRLDATTPSTVGSDHEDTPMQEPKSADSPSLSDIISSETPSEASEESDEEWSPSRRSQQQRTNVQDSQDRPVTRRTSTSRHPDIWTGYDDM
ncbi:hypothetical protein EDD37DRAFT_40739 [Exophiala viscosa]|uniref:uncharacterized protein n=1 Tax=Exophiala viscosa TaxID=2486360 RepID=UPI00219F00CB|nr:hypothetical protein EDD37DRAFT_40739 [Exophiala viscosa]